MTGEITNPTDAQIKAAIEDPVGTRCCVFCGRVFDTTDNHDMHHCEYATGTIEFERQAEAAWEHDLTVIRSAPGWG